MLDQNTLEYPWLLFCLFLLHCTCNWSANLAGLIFKDVSRVCNPLIIMLATPGAITLHLGTTPSPPYPLWSLYIFSCPSLYCSFITQQLGSPLKKGKWDYNILTFNTLQWLPISLKGEVRSLQWTLTLYNPAICVSLISIWPTLPFFYCYFPNI